MLYLDASVFLYRALYSGPKADEADRIMKSVSEGLRPAVTASLTYDEVVWKVMKTLGRVKALEAADAFLAFPNLRIISVSSEHLAQARALMGRYQSLDPRDSIHAAIALSVGAKQIASDDADFDRVAELERVGLGRTASPKKGPGHD